MDQPGPPAATSPAVVEHKIARTADAMDELVDVLSGLKLSRGGDVSRTRLTCPQCGRSRARYCPDCIIPLSRPEAVAGPDEQTVGHVRSPVPPFRLPLRIVVVKHPKEAASKSSAVHAAVLCPDQTRLLHWPELPDDLDENTLLLFPDESAVSVEDLGVDLSNVHTALFLDGTWTQARAMARTLRGTPQGRKLRTVRIRKYATQFWRYQTGEPRWALATIEAIYYLCREVYLARLGQSGQAAVLSTPFDDLLHYFVETYTRVQTEYASPDRHPMGALRQKHYPGYLSSSASVTTASIPSSAQTSSSASSSLPQLSPTSSPTSPVLP